MHFDTELYLTLITTHIELREAVLALEIYNDLIEISDLDICWSMIEYKLYE